MKSWIRRLAVVSACCVVTPAAFAQASAAWPQKPVRMMVPSAAGTAPDVMARLIGERLAKLWGQAVVVENKPGAGGLIGMAAVKAAERDGHAFVFAPASTYALTPYMYTSKQVDVVRDFDPVALIGLGTMLVAVRADSPIQSLPDLVAMARKEPDRFAIATTAQYSLPHLAADLLGKAAGVPMRAIPFTSSSQAITAVVGGDTVAMIDGTPPIDPLIRSNRLKPVAILSKTRVADRSNVATAAESYPSVVVHGWFGITAPKGTPAPVIERVNRDIGTVLAMPEVVERLATLGLRPQAGSVAEFGTFLADERVRWEKALRDVGAKQEDVR